MCPTQVIEDFKASCLAGGIRVSDEALAIVSHDGTEPLTVHEYATTGGITFVLEDNVYVNAPFDDWYCEAADVSLVVDGGSLALASRTATVPVVRVLPLPAYLGTRDSDGRLVSDVCMSHADRIRLSPIAGCAYDCAFCDIPSARYERRPADQLIEAMQIALDDCALPPSHLLISGGSPGRRDQQYFEDVCQAILAACPLPVDVMMTAIPDVDFVDRLVDCGVHGFSLNIELFSDDASMLYIRGKHRLARPGFDAFAERAVARLGSGGRVRSLIVVGLEPIEQTLAGVEHVASLGVDPVLSPFRPARGTKLERASPPPRGDLLQVLHESRRIVARYGVALGPRCAPCQHNTLTFPWDVPVPIGAVTG